MLRNSVLTLHCHGSQRTEEDEIQRAIEASKAFLEDEANFALALKRSRIAAEELVPLIQNENEADRSAYCAVSSQGPAASSVSTMSAVPDNAFSSMRFEGGTCSLQKLQIGDAVVMHVQAHADVGVPAGSPGYVLGINPDGSLHVSFPHGDGFYMKEELLKVEPHCDLREGLPRLELPTAILGANTADEDANLALLMRATALAEEAEAASLAIAIAASHGDGFYMKEELLKVEPHCDLREGLPRLELPTAISGANTADEDANLALLMRATALAEEAEAASLAIAIAASLGNNPPIS